MVHWYPPFFYFPGTKFSGPKLLLNISEHQKECGHMTAVLRHTYLTKKNYLFHFCQSRRYVVINATSVPDKNVLISAL